MREDNGEKGPFGVLPQGPIRRAILGTEFTERKTIGFMAATPTELRSFRRSLCTSALASMFISVYLGDIVSRLPRVALAT